MKRRIVVIGLTALSLLAAACGDDGQFSSPPSATTTSPSTPTVPAADLQAAPWTGKAPNLSPADAATATDWTNKANEALASIDGLNGMWIAVSDPGRGHWTAAQGKAAAGGPAATLADHGQIGSVTKTFTATAVLQQVAAGALSLDDTVQQVLPDVATTYPPTAALTVRQLLNMSSGLPDYANPPSTLLAQIARDPQKVWTPDELIDSALQQPVQPPGTPGYTTTSYQILGLMLEKLTGQPVNQTLTDLAKQAGLDDTALLPPDQTAMPAPSSHGYIDAQGAQDPAYDGTVQAGEDVTDWTISWGGAGGGMYSTVADLFAWTATGMGSSLLPADLAAQRLKTDIPLPEGGYGLGITQFAPGWIGHTGQTSGWSSVGLYNPTTGATCAGITNSTTGAIGLAHTCALIFGLG